MLTPFEYFSKNGSQKLKKILLTSKVSIVERLDFPTIQVQKENGKLSFFRKNEPIELKDRILDKDLSRAISSINEHVEEIPENKILEFSYQTNPIIIQYEKKLANGLAYICERRSNGFIYGSNPTTFPTTTVWSGVLNEEKTSEIISLFSRSSKGISPKSILEALNLKPILNENLNLPIRSLMIRIGSWNPDIILIEDPIYESNRMIEMNSRSANDIYGLVLADFIEHVEIEDLVSKMPIIGESIEDRFLNCVSFLCQSFIDQKSMNYDSKDLGENRLDLSILPKAIQESTKDETSSKLFQMIASSIYSPKKKLSGTITEATISNLNHIKKTISEKATASTKGVMSFKEYLLIKK